MIPSWSASDRTWMRRALALAELGRGRVAPNPMVGAVLLRQGRRISEGWHKRLGGPHAEVACLRGVPRSLTQGATLLVTLEPCCHIGRTAPCTELILASGVSRVVAAMPDPNPLVAGKGLAQLRAAGLDVVSGLLQDEARALNRGFVSQMERGRPWITLKWAQSLDGRIAERAGYPTALSGAESRQETAWLRARHTGILVGSGTALADDPQLDLRDLSLPAPRRVVLDSRARLPLDSKLVRSAGSQTLIVVCGSKAPAERRRRLEEAGVRVLQQPAALQPTLDWLLPQLPALGVDSLLVEGGAAVHAAFLQAGLVDELLTITSPLLLGRGIAPVAAGSSMEGRQAWRLSAQRGVGADSWQWWRPATREA